MKNWGRWTKGALVFSWISGCAPPQPSSPVSDTTSSLVQKVEDSLRNQSKELIDSLQTLKKDISSPSSSSPSTAPLPKREPWMDTLTDLAGVPPPNSAILLEEDPMPKNLRSIEILIAQRYRPTQPVQLVLRTYVSEKGTVSRYQLLRTSDPKLTPEYFVPPLLELRFSPALYGGKPVSAWTTLTLKIPSNL
ncbi:MAG: hypothetical protein RMK19_03460 [Bacteroidia bacterium]|nr:hypothetical protein [Bacteroidia bacterium]MDW8015048.1 hypothetical protein [Bacteroidia bacterium]